MVYKDIEFKDISLIKELWEKNRVYHENTSQYFGDDYSNLIFEERLAFLRDISPENIKITVALNENNPEGYCISVRDEDEAEIVSLHVEKEVRGQGIGKLLSKKHFDWFRENECKSINIEVSIENNNTIGFYKRLGFLPNILQMKCRI